MEPTTDTEATDAEREAAAQIVAIFRDIDGSRKVSRADRKWETALDIAAPHMSEDFINELCRQAGEVWADPGLLLKIFLGQAMNAQGQPPAVGK